MAALAVVDIDGVIADFVGDFTLWNDEKHPSLTKWDFHREWGWSDDTFVELFAEYTETGRLRFLDTIGDAARIEASLAALMNAGFEIMFLTSRPKNTQDDTVHWLTSKFPVLANDHGASRAFKPGVSIHFAHGPKSHYVFTMRGFDGVYVIDDSPIELESWVDVTEGDEELFLIYRVAWEYNAHLDGDVLTAFTFEDWAREVVAIDQDLQEEAQEMSEEDEFINRRDEVLRTANTLVNGDRNNQYGSPSQDFARTAGMWTALFGGKQAHDGSTVPFDAHDVALAIAAVKMSRLTWDPLKMDSWVDAAGYFACGADCVDELLDGDLR